MVFRKLRCYVCDGRFAPRLMTRIDGDDNAAKREIAINRRDGFQRPALEVTDLTKICTNCNQSIRNEIVAIEEDPACLRLNVLTQTRNSTCLICDRTDKNVLSIECKANVFISHNIFIPQNTKSCQHHLNVEGMLLGPLVQGLRFINRPYVIRGLYLQAFLQGLRNVTNQPRKFDENNLSDSEFQCLCPINKQQFAELFTFCDTVPCTGGYRYVHKKDLLMFLCKMRQGLSDEFLRIIFQYPSRRATSMAVATVRQSLMLRFVPQNIGFDAITRQDYIDRHVTDFDNILYNAEPQTRRVITCIDGTYMYIQKSSNFRALRQSYCVHKGRHLVKPVLIVAPDGYILDIQGPYFSDSRNNDAAILQNEADADRMLRWFQEDDIVIVDRGYRDAIDLLRRLGITWKMPALLPRNQCQLSTDEANESRLVTKQRWIVEARNGHLKLIFKFLQQTISMHHVPNLGDFCRIAGAIINRYHPTIEMEGADAEKAYEMLEKAKEPNIVQALVEVENLKTRNAQRWVPINDAQLVDFPMLDIEYLKMLTVGIYQIKLAPAYVQDNVQRNDDEQFHIDMLRDANRLPQPGLLRVRIYSRFRNAAKYQLWITYRPNDDNEVDDGMDGNMNEEVSPILGYYCTCKSGTRTLGTCAHISSILWYLGYARYQENIHYPSTRLIQTVADAGNRPLPRNDHMP
ncbi:PREDICTED: uncharacterized protein LOC108778997 [Cyphomyrmex costatus]|uniref:uncharacterized protein LOC108778997 n=1 Tax=Cyphomyrmex costatus TaxID=456900 RepID=UPI0008523C31|nr:PREDICTED: uncharacterized protein LOC108778997 [Cyphomyrmex costatus]